MREPRQVDEESVDHGIFIAKMELRFFPRCDIFFLMLARAMRVNQSDEIRQAGDKKSQSIQ